MIGCVVRVALKNQYYLTGLVSFPFAFMLANERQCFDLK